MHASRHEHRNIIEERPRRRSSSVEAQHVVSYRRHLHLEELPVAIPRTNRLYRRPVPLHVDERRLLLRGRRERARLEEADAVLLSCARREWLGGGKRARERIEPIRRPEQRNRVTGVCEWGVEEDRRVIDAACGARPRPGGVADVVAEIAAFGEVLEAAVDNKVGALVATRKCHLEVTLAGVDCGGGIRWDEILDDRGYIVAL